MSKPDTAAHWSLRALMARSADLETSVAVRLAAFCDAPRPHALFLNTLSLMEHIGSRKIMASQSPAQPNLDTLKHLAEEARHAFFFKRSAEGMAKRTLGYGDAEMLAGHSARAYMGRLDAHIAKELGENVPAHLPYLYMSLIIELRAIWMYRLYDHALRAADSRLSLRSVLAEEELHLAEMLEAIAAADSEMDSRLEGFMTYEDGRFRTLWAAISHAADAAKPILEGAR
jgi:hypothetical protein